MKEALPRGGAFFAPYSVIPGLEEPNPESRDSKVRNCAP
ncbi:protein of unknown function [Bradyrhizobium vignae]|uniref:Uncharacterized protein n=1 Tax=Bradyrhizobium vignae TaxID=1549949 RepID=A0A2U3PZ88_9BRAD|nr:protein of unknown function [Bradyrhizobium vignae]